MLAIQEGKSVRRANDEPYDHLPEQDSGVRKYLKIQDAVFSDSGKCIPAHQRAGLERNRTNEAKRKDIASPPTPLLAEAAALGTMRSLRRMAVQGLAKTQQLY
jgi:hypothetical protein